MLLLGFLGLDFGSTDAICDLQFRCCDFAVAAHPSPVAGDANRFAPMTKSNQIELNRTKSDSCFATNSRNARIYLFLASRKKLSPALKMAGHAL